MKKDESRIVDITNAPALTIGAYRPPFTWLMNSAEDAIEAYRLFTDAGLNMIVNSGDVFDEKFDWVIAACEKFGVKIFHDLPRDFYTDEPEKGRPVVEKLLSTPAFIGFSMSDEPSAEKFPELAKAREASEAMMPPDKFSIANLFPNWCGQAQTGIDGKYDYVSLKPEDPYEHYTKNGSYTEYVRRYLDEVKPRALSYDNYVISDECRIDTGWEYIRCYGFLRNLAIARVETKKRGLPFWNIIQTWGYNKHMAAPNLYELRWQANASYVFGCAILIYFVYQNSYPEGTGPESWVDAPLDYDGNLTPQYDRLKEANAELHAFGKAFSQYEQVGVMIFNPKLYQKHVLLDELELKEFPPLEAVGGGGNIIVGCMVKGGSRGLYVMNGSYKEESVTELFFDKKRRFELWGKAGLESSELASSLPLALEPGEAKFIAFEAD